MGCSILGKAFGDASKLIDNDIVPRFLFALLKRFPRDVRNTTNIMTKKFLLLIAVAISSTMAWADVTINTTTFPDAAFRSYVMSRVAGASDGKLTNAELAKVTVLAPNKLGISDLTGIEHFTSLKRLGCAGNNLKKLDLKANIKLNFLDCSNNDLSEIDLSNNTLIDTLGCNGNNLTTIDLSHNPNLVRLVAHHNNLKELDFSHNAKLAFVNCAFNCLKELNLDNNINLETLVCYYNSICELDLSKHNKITDLQVQGNLLKELDLSNMQELIHLTCGRNNLSKLDFSANKKLNHINCADNHLLQLREPAGATFTDWKTDPNVSTTNFKADQNVVLTAELTKVNGLDKYVITMPKDFVDNNVTCYSVGRVEKTNELNGTPGTYFIIEPNDKPDGFYYMYYYNNTVNFSVSVNVIYKADPCDANGDGTIDIADVNKVINAILMKN